MSYSRKKHPFVGITTASSEREDKRIAHRRERHAVRQQLHSDPLVDVLPHRKDFGDKREFSKDGKWYLPNLLDHWQDLYHSMARRLRK